MPEQLFLSTKEIIRFTHKDKSVCLSTDGKPVALDAEDAYVATLIRKGMITKVSETKTSKPNN